MEHPGHRSNLAGIPRAYVLVEVLLASEEARQVGDEGGIPIGYVASRRRPDYSSNLCPPEILAF